MKSFFEIRGSTSHTWSIILGTIPILVLIGIWWYITAGDVVEERIVSPVTLPSPWEVLQSIPSLITKGKLLEGIAASFQRVAIGFLIAVAVALPL